MQEGIKYHRAALAMHGCRTVNEQQQILFFFSVAARLLFVKKDFCLLWGALLIEDSAFGLAME